MTSRQIYGFTGGGIPVVSTLADVNTLIAGCGGNSLFSGFYDRRVNVTLSTLNVTAWADARSVGPGPTITTIATGTKPTVTVAGSPISFTSGGTGMFTSAVAAFQSGGPCALVYVGGNIGPNLSLVLATVEFTAECGVGTDGSNHWDAVTGNVLTKTSSLVANNVATVRVVVSDVASGGAVGGITVYNRTRVQTTGLTSTAANSELVLGSDSTSASTAHAQIISAIIVMNVVPSSAQIGLLGAWGVAQHSATAA